jgi:hypothetical protein
MLDATEAAIAPDLIEPIVGWRLWLVVEDGGYLWLESVLYPIRWLPQRALVARCVPHRRCYLCRPREVQSFPSHPAPDEECECGIYAARSPEALTRYLDSTYPGRQAVECALGRVRLWGKVVEAKRGWRGQYAYPDTIYVPDRLAAHAGTHSAHRTEDGLRDYGRPVRYLRERTTLETVAPIAAAS